MPIRALREPSSAGDDRNEIMNWDVAIDVAPDRPSGTITVTLKFAGRGIPAPFTDARDQNTDGMEGDESYD